MASTDMIKTVMNAVKVRFNSLTAKISKLEDGVKINTSNIENELNELPKKMDKTNPVATGSFSLNRMNGSVVGTNSFAEGYDTTASGNSSHAEGNNTTASGSGSHAEGISTKASGNASHAEGGNTTAISDFQHVQGKYNIADTGNKYAHIVGNGTSNDNLSNAHTLDWKGNAWFAGTVEGKSVILSSSATDSTKKFKVTVDDTGEPTFTDTSDSSISYTPYSPPIVTSDDAGKFLRVSSTGEWAAESISNAEGASF